VNSASPWSGSGRRGPDPQCVAELHKVVEDIERSWTGPLFYCLARSAYMRSEHNGQNPVVARVDKIVVY